MKSRTFWAARPLLVLLFMLTAAPLGAIRPDVEAGGSRGDGRGCPEHLTRVGVLAAEPGISMAIVRDSETTTCVAGVRRAWSRDPVTPDSVFDAASLSKPLVAYAALRLVDQGRLDLDAPIRGAHGTYSLRQLLAHSAGFDNTLSDRPAASGPAGRFQYSGAGYIVVGRMISEAAGVPFDVYMNTVILPELGMTRSSFGPAAATTPLRASPSIDAGLVIGAFGLVTATVGAASFALLALLFGLASGIGGRRRTEAAWAAAAVAAAVGLGSLGLLLGWRNLPASGAVALAFLVLAVLAGVTAGRRTPRDAAIAVAASAAALGLLILRPAVPLQLRDQAFLAPAGLRTTASDYARFLAHLGEAAADRSSAVALMRTPVVEAGPDAYWTLGLGRRRGDEAALWHWGVNFPGYQALALGWPDGTVAVVLVNGGALSLSPDGLRYSGLELAQSAVTEVRAGEDQGPLWRAVQ